MQKLCCVRTRQHSLPVWIISSQVHHRISTNSQPFSVGIVSGTFTSNQEIQLEQVMLPEFFKTRKIDYVQAKIFTTPCQYDMILGRDLLNDLGIILDFKKQKYGMGPSSNPHEKLPK